MMDFVNCKSIEKLKKFAKNPPDLSKKDALSPERVSKFSIKKDDFSLLFGTELVDDNILSSLNDLAKERCVVEQMKNMQHGDIVNTWNLGDDKKTFRALHSATRLPLNAKYDGDKWKNVSDIVEDVKSENEKLQKFIEKDCSQFSELIVVGIGGSDLGPRAVYIALEKFSIKNRKVHFISNIDPDDAAKVLSKVNIQKALILVISKSGSTLETVTNESLVRKYCEDNGITNCEEKFIAVTEKGSPMATSGRYREIFFIYDCIGGRFSVSSMVGGVIIAFAFGYDVYSRFLQGAHQMDLAAMNDDFFSNIPLMAAMLSIWNRNFLMIQSTAIIPYSQSLERFTAHLQQCDMESNGKSCQQFVGKTKTKTGPIIWGEPGTNGQHSFFQWIHQGSDKCSVEFIGFSKNQRNFDDIILGTSSQEKLLANMFAQSIALATGFQDKMPYQTFDGNRPNRILLTKQLTPETMGGLLAFYEHKIAFQGFVWGLNSFDQPGVELGKKLAKDILEIFKNRREKKPSNDSNKLINEFLSFLI